MPEGGTAAETAADTATPAAADGAIDEAAAAGPSGDAARAAAEATVDASLRDAPVLDRDGYAYLVHPLMDGVPRVDPRLLRAWSAWAGPRLGEVDLVVAPEAMALPLAAAIALDHGIPYVVVRKRAYGLEGEHHAPAATGYGASDLHLNDVRSGERVLVVDDVISTGGTLDATMALIAAAGADVQGVLVFLSKGGAAARAARRLGIPVEAMRDVRVEDGIVLLDGASARP